MTFINAQLVGFYMTKAMLTYANVSHVDLSATCTCTRTMSLHINDLCANIEKSLRIPYLDYLNTVNYVLSSPKYYRCCFFVYII